MKDIFGGLIAGVALFLLYLMISDVVTKTSTRPPSELPATTEQMVIIHYIKHNWPEVGNEVAMEHYDGTITQEDYQQILGRVQQQINRKGLSHFYGQRNPE